jgi:heat shock protein HspQ
LKFIEQTPTKNVHIGPDNLSEYIVPHVKVDKYILNTLIPSSLHTMHSAQDFLATLRLVYRSKQTLNKLEINLVDNGFRVIKQLNSMNEVLKSMYEKHLLHKDPMVAKKAKIAIGKVCEHVVHGYRGVVIGWSIDEATGKQELTLLVDTSDYSEFLSLVAVPDHEKVRRLSLAEARLVSDDNLRISNSALFSGYFTKFDLNLKQYIPNKELRFCFPLNCSDGSSQKLSRRGSHATKLSKDQLDRQQSLKQVRQSLLDLCADLLDIVRLYSIPQSLLDLSLDEAREAEVTDADRAAFPAVAETVSDLKSIEGHLRNAATTSSATPPPYRTSPTSEVMLWGPRLYGAKNSTHRPRQVSSSPDLAVLVHEAAEMLSITYKHLEKTLQFRFQQYGVGHIDDLLSVYHPARRNERRAINFGAEWALRRERELTKTIASEPTTGKSSQENRKSNFEVLSAVPTDLAIEDNTLTPTAHFSVGQVVLHKRFGYRGVVYGYDQRPPMDVSDWAGVKDLVHKENQPFYWVCLSLSFC